jgi:hypothetical protein
VKRVIAVLAVVPALFVTACGGDDDESAATVKGVEYAFEMPETVEGGLVRMNFENAGAIPHEYALGRINESRTVEDLRAYLEETGGREGPPPWAEDVGGVGVMSAGTEIGITRDLEPGTYAFLCFLPTSDGKTTHLEEGMFQGFEVEGESGAEPPETDGSITATGKAFEVSELSGGPQTIELRNGAERPTGFQLFGLEPGQDPKDVEPALQKWFRSGFEGEAPATLYGTVQFVPPGESYYLDIDLESGQTYLIIDPEAGLQEVIEVG